MKNYKTNSKLAHAWAKNASVDGQTSNRNFFFDGKTIYSYGYHYIIGQFEQAENRAIYSYVTFINGNSYSNSTAKHTKHVEKAIPNYYPTFNIPFIINEEFSLKDLKQIRLNWIETIKELFKGQLKARSNTYKHFEAITIMSKINEINALFPSYIENINNDYFGEAFILSENKANLLRDTAETRKAEQKEKLRIGELKLLDDWINHNYNGHLYYSKIHLRIKDGFLQTSHGATVKLSDAVCLLKDIRDAKNMIGTKIGAYRVRFVGLDQITIGCHVIQWEVINEFFDNLKTV